jgi:hypothetical protein
MDTVYTIWTYKYRVTFYNNLIHSMVILSLKTHTHNFYSGENLIHSSERIMIKDETLQHWCQPYINVTDKLK